MAAALRKFSAHGNSDLVPIETAPAGIPAIDEDGFPVAPQDDLQKRGLHRSFARIAAWHGRSG